MTAEGIQAGQPYTHTYFIFVDAAGYSTIVAGNPIDRSGAAFNLLRERLIDRVERTARSRRCSRAELWQWRGDGGFFVVHDDNESVARDVALESASMVLAFDLRHLRDEFRLMGVQGQLRIRLAVHRGVFHYLGDHHERSVHSTDVNFAAHLERASPPDCLTISEDVYQVAAEHTPKFRYAGSYEGRAIYLMTPTGSERDARRAWLTHHGPAGWGQVHAHDERPSQEMKARLLDLATADVIDMGTALNTCSNYLSTTERPALYRTAVLDFLRLGGTYRGILLDPKSAAVEEISAAREEDLETKIVRSVERFAQFKSAYSADTEEFHLYYSEFNVGFHALGIDLTSAEGIVLYSPYVGYALPPAMQLERADMPHYLLTPAAGGLFARIERLIVGQATSTALRQVL